MEESVNGQFDTCLQKAFDLKEVNVNTYSPLALAYIGDSIYDLMIRTLVVSEGNQPVWKLHKKTTACVQASAQSRMMRVLRPLLTEEESAVYRRGKNAKNATTAKNQTLSDYHRATGFEALMGYFYLKKEWGRMLELVKIGLESLEENTDT